MSDSIKIPNPRVLERKLTSERRKDMKIVVLTFNLSNNKLSSTEKLYLKQLFQESKYYYNYLLFLSQQTIVDDFGNLIYPCNIFNFDTKINLIQVYDSSLKQFIDYELNLLSSQMKQKIRDKLTDNIKGLFKKKINGSKIGKLKYKSSVNIPLKQFNNTYRLDDDFKYLTIQGNNKKHFKLNPNKALNKFSNELGFNKLSINDLLNHEIIELANAELIRKNNRYKFNLTIYINPVILNKNTQQEFINKLHLHETNNYKFYQKVRINPNRTQYLNTPLKVLSKFISLNKKNNQSEPVNLDNIFECINKHNIKHNNIKKYGVIKQFHMNLSQEQLDLLSNTCLGIDAGIADEMTLNCGELYQSISIDSRNNPYLVKTLEKIKNTQTELNHFINRSKKLNRKNGLNIYNKSRQYYEIKGRLNKLWDKYDNIKDNMVNHVVSFLKHFKQVYFQEEMIKSWHQDKLKSYGKKIQQGILGKVYAKLKALAKINPEKYIMLNKSLRTTKTCALCKKINTIKLSDRIYECSCGYRNKRDCHSAYNMMILSNNKELNNLISKKVSGIDAYSVLATHRNLVKTLTADSHTAKVHTVVNVKLISKSHINSLLSCYEQTSEAPSFLLKSSASAL